MCFFSLITDCGILESFIMKRRYRSVHLASVVVILVDTMKLSYLHKLTLSELLFVCHHIHSKYEDIRFPVAAVILCCQCWLLRPLFSDSFPDKSCNNVFLVVLAGDNVEEFEQVQDKQSLKIKSPYIKKKKVTAILKFKSFSS